jgi:hypothetical protein
LKRWKKIVLVLLVLLVISQVPFAFRGYQLSKLRSGIAQLNAGRRTNSGSRYIDLKGVIHVHSDLGGHSTGTLPAIVRAAKANGLDFAIMTEHPSSEVDTAEQTLGGLHNGVIFLAGNEVTASNGDRFLITRATERKQLPSNESSQQIVDSARATGDLTFAAYPAEVKDWNVRDLNGIEVYNLYTNSKKVRPLLMVFDGIWSYWGYADLLFARIYQRPSAELALYDHAIESQHRPLVAIAGNDAHQNVGFGLSDATGKQIAFVQLDPYERSFATVRNHALIDSNGPLTPESLLSALRKGHCYISFDIFCDASGFLFTAESGDQQALMGDEVQFSPALKLNVEVPVQARVTLYRDGKPIETRDNAAKASFSVGEPGAYRVEVYLPQLGSLVADKPWILSNPIYVR